MASHFPWFVVAHGVIKRQFFIDVNVPKGNEDHLTSDAQVGITGVGPLALLLYSKPTSSTSKIKVARISMSSPLSVFIRPPYRD